MGRLITLTTDFGESYYVGQLKGVIKKVDPGADVVDITHNVNRHNILEAAFILSRIVKYFPFNTIHVVVVDPGVGTGRKALAVETERMHLVGPDNGVLRWALREQKVTRMIELNPKTIVDRNGLGEVSNTFHGRDVFAPAAALLSKGVDMDMLGKKTSEMGQLKVRENQVVHIDGFGNIVTTIAKVVEPGKKVVVKYGGREYEAVCGKTFADAEEGQLIVLRGSHGLLEVDVCEGDARSRLNAVVGESIEVEDAG